MVNSVGIVFLCFRFYSWCLVWTDCVVGLDGVGVVVGCLGRQVLYSGFVWILCDAGLLEVLLVLWEGLLIAIA